MNFGILIIGDEILSGYREDKHIKQSIRLLNARGHRLRWCQIVGDEPGQIIKSLRLACEEDIPVFCFGGIGATPDDFTRQCAAEAFELALIAHPDAVAIIEKQFGDGAYPKRIMMAHLPAGAALIPNPVNNIPGFSIDEIYFLPGFPQMAGPMMDWVLSHYPDALEADYERMVFRVYNGHESEFIDTMNAIMALDEKVSISSLPVLGKEKNYVDFVVSGKRKIVDKSRSLLLACIDQQAAEYEIITEN